MPPPVLSCNGGGISFGNCYREDSWTSTTDCIMVGRLVPGYPDADPTTSMPELHMAKSDDSAKMPSHVDDRLSLFDRFATYTSERVPRAWFFGVCALLVLIWVPTFWLWPSIDGWALVINTFTSTITFLLVALLQRTLRRAPRTPLNASSMHSPRPLRSSWTNLTPRILIYAGRATN